MLVKNQYAFNELNSESKIGGLIRFDSCRRRTRVLQVTSVNGHFYTQYFY